MVDFTPRTTVTESARNWGLMVDEGEARGQRRWANRELRDQVSRDNVTNRETAALLRRQLSERFAPLLEPPNTSGYTPSAPAPSGPMDIRPPEAPAAQAGLTVEQQQGNEQFARAMTARQPAATDAFPLTTAALDAPDHGALTIQMGPDVPYPQRTAYAAYRSVVEPYIRGTGQGSGVSENMLRMRVSAMADVGLISSAQAQQLIARHIASRNHFLGAPRTPVETGTDTKGLRTTPVDVSGRVRPAQQAGVQTATASEQTLRGRATEVGSFLQQNGIRVNSTVRQHNAGREHPNGNAIDIDASSQAEVDRAVQLISQQYGVQARGMFLQGGTRNANGTTNTGDHGHISLSGGAPATPGGPQRQAGLTTEEDVAENPSVDISRPTGGGNRQIALVRAQAQAALERAQLLAGRGSVAAADEAMAQALQYQAAILGEDRRTQVRQLDMGNLRAGAALIADLNDYDPETVQFAPSEGNPELYNLQVRGADGTWQTTNRTPMSIDDWTGQMHRIVNAEQAAAQDEAAAARYEILMDRQTRLDVANIEASSRVFATMSEERRELLRAETQLAIAERRAQIVTNSETGTQTVVYWGTDAETGEPELQTDILGMRDEEAPSVDGNGETVSVPYRQRVTGMPGVSAR